MITQAEVNAFLKKDTPLMGGISPEKAREMLIEMQGVSLASRKLYLIELIDLDPNTDPDAVAKNFQMFTVDLAFSPITIPPEKKQIGSAVMDGVKTTEPVEMRLTTLDTKEGSIKRWFADKSAKIAHQDGTVGLPIDYVVEINVLHSYFSHETDKGGYQESYMMRPVSAEYDFSREDGGLQRLNLVFTQFDTFLWM